MEAKVIIAGNMKGGVGKSSLTAILATYIHNTLKKEVLVIDADDLQQTISTIRKDELLTVKDHSKLFPVLESNSKDALRWVTQVMDEYDYIFIDLPGNLKQEGVINSYLLADIIIIPTSLSKEDMDATFRFYEILNKDIIPKRKEEGLETIVKGLLYKVRKRGKEYKEFEEEFKNNIPLAFFEEVIPNSDVLRRQTSTFDNVDFESKSFEMKSFLSEFSKIL